MPSFSRAGLLRSMRALAALATLVSGAGCMAAPAAAPERVTVLAAGDIAECGHIKASNTHAASTATLVAAYLARDPLARVLALGDLVYPSGTAHDFSACYQPTWGRFKARTLPAPGNHEYSTSGARGYFDYFGALAGPGYYAVSLGSWRVISLDSNTSGAAMAAQLAWLKRELATHPTRCTLAYWHHPMYSSGGHGNLERMRAAWELLQQGGADIVLSGHDHDYERFAPQDAHGRPDANGIRQFVVGTGGAFMTPFLRLRANSEMRDNSRYGVLKLELEAGRYRWEFLEADYDGLPNGQAADRGEGQCH